MGVRRRRRRRRRRRKRRRRRRRRRRGPNVEAHLAGRVRVKEGNPQDHSVKYTHPSLPRGWGPR